MDGAYAYLLCYVYKPDPEYYGFEIGGKKAETINRNLA